MIPLEQLQLICASVSIIGSVLSYFDTYQSPTYTITLAVVRIIGAILTIVQHTHDELPYTYVVAPPTDRPLPTNRKEDPCPITFEPFNPGNTYTECQQCHHWFHTVAICQSLMNYG